MLSMLTNRTQEAVGSIPISSTRINRLRAVPQTLQQPLAQTAVECAMRRRSNREGSIYQSEDANGKPRWYAACPGGSPRFSAKTQAEAVAKRNAFLRANPHKAVRRSSGSLAAFLVRWLDRVKGTVRQNTYASYRLTVERWIIPAIRDVSIATMSEADVQQAIRYAAQKGKHRTAEYVRIVLKIALNVAVNEGRMTRNPAKLIKPHGYQKRKANPVYGEELTALLSHVAGTDHEAIVLVDLMGLRRGELLGLQWGDYSDGILRIERQLLRIAGKLACHPVKSEKGIRTIALPELVRTALERHRVRQMEMFMALGAPDALESSHIFTSRIGTPIDPRNACRIFTRIFKAAKIPHRTMHDMRHSAATLLLASGAQLHEVQDWLGHAKYAFTKDTYAHAVPQGIAKTGERFNGILK